MRKLRTGKAPGHPGAGPHWESSRKTGVGRACNSVSRVWFTIGDGILNEIYYPRPDQPCTKDCGLLITDGRSFFSEEKCDTESVIEWARPGVPAFRIVNTHRGGLYRIHKEVVADPQRNVILQRTRFEPLHGNLANYRLYMLLAPHLGDEGIHNSGSFGSFKGRPMLFAESKSTALAVACSSGWKGRSVGFVGTSDGWQDLSQHKELRWHYDEAEDGNVALTGEVYLDESGSFVLGIGFGDGKSEAAYQVHVALMEDFNQVWTRYVTEWEGWQKNLASLKDTMEAPLFLPSAAVLRVHEAVDYPGARMASLSVPWGEVQEQEQAAGYHAVWARDCSQSALGLLACGLKTDVRRTLDYLGRVQEADGRWPQIMWADGEAKMTGIQVDSIAAPLILYEISRQEGVFDDSHPAARYWPMIRKAAEFICRNGPTSQQDRWERNAGFSIYTLSMAIAGLVVAGKAAEDNGRTDLASYFLEMADAWNAQIDNWTYFRGSEMAQALGLPGYYCRVIPPDAVGRPDFSGDCRLENSQVKKDVVASDVVSPDVWALVRYGLRSPGDEKVRQTTTAIDATLKTETPRGPVWHRYNYDGYGERKDGAPFCKEGIGRGWPLFVGERGHYELARANRAEAERLLTVMGNFGNEIGLLPEQVWDTADIPDKNLGIGHATGSARPLAWAHAEYLQLLRSLCDGRIFGCPLLVAYRYAEQTVPPKHTPWRFDLQTPHLIRGTSLRIETPGPVHLHWSSDGGSGDVQSNVSPIHLHYTDLPTTQLTTGTIKLNFLSEDRRNEIFVVRVDRE